MKVKKWLVVAIFLGLVTLTTYGCGGGGGPTGPSSSIVDSWGGYWQVYGTYVTITFKADGKYEELRANLPYKFTGTYALGTWPNGSGKVTITKTHYCDGVYRHPIVLTWS
jgi:hypothetical protein